MKEQRDERLDHLRYCTWYYVSAGPAGTVDGVASLDLRLPAVISAEDKGSSVWSVSTIRSMRGQYSPKQDMAYTGVLY